jgi:hypothetical protein
MYAWCLQVVLLLRDLLLRGFEVVFKEFGLHTERSWTGSVAFSMKLTTSALIMIQTRWTPSLSSDRSFITGHSILSWVRACFMFSICGVPIESACFDTICICHFVLCFGGQWVWWSSRFRWKAESMYDGWSKCSGAEWDWAVAAVIQGVVVFVVISAWRWYDITEFC